VPEYSDELAGHSILSHLFVWKFLVYPELHIQSLPKILSLALSGTEIEVVLLVVGAIIGV
jgi:hypothetical protein